MQLADSVTLVTVAVLAFLAFRSWLGLQERRRVDQKLDHEVLTELKTLRARCDESEAKLAKVLTQLSSVQGGFAAARNFRGLRGGG